MAKALIGLPLPSPAPRTLPPASITVPIPFPHYSFRVRNSAPCPRPASLIRMGLKIVQDYDSSFDLKPECQDLLRRLLSSATFRSQVAGQCHDHSSEYEFTGELFQPVPWSITTKHGMPQAFEKYFDNPDYAIVNVPPNFMFQAKIFRPSRLCAIFRKVEKNNLET